MDSAIRPFKLRFFICDAVARQYLKRIQNPNSTSGCEKCLVQGVRYRNRMIFLDFDAPLRSDRDFRLRRDEDHHIGEAETPLEFLGINMVSQFKLDPMHLVDIGVFKRWLKFLLGKLKGIPALLSNAEQAEVSRRIKVLSTNMPKEISRHPRPFEYFAKYKATEFRRMVRYDGLIIFKNLHHDVYFNFLLLFCGIYILSDLSLIERHGDLADQFLRQFVAHSAQLFGPHFVVYNVHNWIHLYNESVDAGSLHNFSAYKYENYYGVMKRYLLSTHKPLADNERNGRLIQNSRSKSVLDSEVSPPGVHNDWEEEGAQYTTLRTSRFILSRRLADSCLSWGYCHTS
ncbi:UDP-N-acetylglucosamine--N-acetylmuramyl-(pentapeptide) pyrophosphoryl-undecaprenol N-acetylglucosamine transferase [Frankliniella fusca]|uniref:UDP-N-acetylglucosamine--N-acetylmuramyl-(Pentapeptide) pyrophosphoryl-undecaprenol N-acetylglucosamine transferase n=1 Tax=Frankliniella fusca TaxID=407009 RepID=A0AAE1GXX9_9NEOP|nr:UDP-N-acetylglucosamine--N-acetylmuramyl-(pentapeptide) pyrophosphoryl-undecaprenol N-acetylglucosamine transferase [Frankliniella fusca]